MYMPGFMLLPGQTVHKFTIYTKKPTVSAAGSVGQEGWKKGESICGTLTNTSPKETEQWKQDGHPISNKIIQFGIKNRAKEKQYLQLVDASGISRTFYIEGVKNPGNLDHFTIYFVDERKDLKPCQSITDPQGQK